MMSTSRCRPVLAQDCEPNTEQACADAGIAPSQPPPGTTKVHLISTYGRHLAGMQASSLTGSNRKFRSAPGWPPAEDRIESGGSSGQKPEAGRWVRTFAMLGRVAGFPADGALDQPIVASALAVGAVLDGDRFRSGAERTGIQRAQLRHW